MASSLQKCSSYPISSFFTQHVFYISVAGYNYFGNERLYSGIDGREFEADVFFGVVYYQRLRHMVADKFQVLSRMVYSELNKLSYKMAKGERRVL